MNGADVVEAALRHEPDLLRSLVHQLAGVDIGGPLSPLPDAPLTTFQGAAGSWFAVATLDATSKEQRGSWPLALSSLARATGADGDLVLLTSAKSAARWARRPLRREGLLGTRLSLTPYVLQIGLEEAEILVHGPSPHAALVAAWGVQRKDGPRTRAVVEALVRRLDEVPPEDRPWWLHATLQLLSATQLAHIRAMRDALPSSEAFSQFCSAIEAQAQARGKAASLLRFLELRRVPLSPEQRGFIASCSDLPTVDRWVEAVFSAASKGSMIEAIFNPIAPPLPPADLVPEPPDVDPVSPEPPPLTPEPPEARPSPSALAPEVSSAAPEAEEIAQA